MAWKMIKRAVGVKGSLKGTPRDESGWLTMFAALCEHKKGLESLKEQLVAQHRHLAESYSNAASIAGFFAHNLPSGSRDDAQVATHRAHEQLGNQTYEMLQHSVLPLLDTQLQEIEAVMPMSEMRDKLRKAYVKTFSRNEEAIASADPAKMSKAQDKLQDAEENYVEYEDLLLTTVKNILEKQEQTFTTIFDAWLRYSSAAFSHMSTGPVSPWAIS